MCSSLLPLHSPLCCTRSQPRIVHLPQVHMCPNITRSCFLCFKVDSMIQEGLELMEENAIHIQRIYRGKKYRGASATPPPCSHYVLPVPAPNNRRPSSLASLLVLARVLLLDVPTHILTPATPHAGVACMQRSAHCSRIHACQKLMRACWLSQRGCSRTKMRQRCRYLDFCLDTAAV